MANDNEEEEKHVCTTAARSSQDDSWETLRLMLIGPGKVCRFGLLKYFVRMANGEQTERNWGPWQQWSSVGMRGSDVGFRRRFGSLACEIMERLASPRSSDDAQREEL